MVDHAWRALRPRRLAVHTAIGGTAGCEAGGEVSAIAWARERTAPLHHRSSYPAKADDDGSRYCATAANQNRSRSVEELKRVNRRRPFADLEVELRRPHLAGLTRLGNDLAALDRLAALHQQFTRMSICGDITVGVPNQNQIAITLELISGIGDDAVLGGLHWCAFGHRQ